MVLGGGGRGLAVAALPATPSHRRICGLRKDVGGTPVIELFMVCVLMALIMLRLLVQYQATWTVLVWDCIPAEGKVVCEERDVLEEDLLGTGPGAGHAPCHASVLSGVE